MMGKEYTLDARVTQTALDESQRVVKRGHGVTITETAHGFVCANSGVDASNVDGGHSVVLLPRDPDHSAQNIYRMLKNRLGFPVPVIISDSFGRAWREGLTEVAIGLAGMRAFRDSRGACDPYGYKLKVTLEAVADELACMAGLACGKLTRIPACIIRGLSLSIRDAAVLATSFVPLNATCFVEEIMQVIPQPWNASDIWNELRPSYERSSRSAGAGTRINDGTSLTQQECLTLAEPSGDELLALAAAADMLRQHLVGDNVTYVVNRNINFTNVCFVGCKFCAFYRGPNLPKRTLFPRTGRPKAVEAWDLGATEVCIQGGLPHGLDKFYYRDILRAIKKAVPGMHIHAFSPMEITYGVQLTGMDLRDYLTCCVTMDSTPCPVPPPRSCTMMCAS